MRRFYIAHGDVLSDVRPSDISATPLRISPDPWTPTAASHYLTLMSVSDPEARRFYEIEAADNDWSVRELKRQLDSSLYQRLALSRDRHEVRRLAREGQVVEKASDLIKDPLVPEFLGLETRPARDRKKDAVVELTPIPRDANTYVSKYERYMAPRQEHAARFANAWREFEQREGGGYA